jgi:hypothetical protein
MRWILSALCGLLVAPLLAGPFAPVPPTGPGPGGLRAACDLPGPVHKKNVGGSDGAGLCVFTSIWHSAQWQSVHELDGYRAYMERRPGGGYPSKVDATMRAYCAEKGVPVPPYVQHTGGDPAFLELAIKTGRMVAVTYDGRDDFYRGRIAHMVNLVHIDSTGAAILDNNRPGVFVWMSRADFLARWKGGGGGWAVVLLASPPPPYATAPGPVPTPSPSPQPDPQPVRPRPRPCPGPGPCPAGPWRPLRYGDGADRWFLYGDRGEFAGVWDARGWHPAAPGGGWYADPRGNPPVPGPHDPSWQAPRVDDYGVDLDALAREAPGYTLNGEAVGREAAFAAFGDLLADDSGRWNLTTVGDVPTAADLAALPAAARDRLHVQRYPPAAWEVSQFGLAPGVSLRRPAVGRVGAEAGRLAPADYTPARLADLLRELDGPRPKPAPVPDPLAPPLPPDPEPDPEPTPDPAPKPNPAGGALAAMLAALLFLLTGPRPTK